MTNPIEAVHGAAHLPQVTIPGGEEKRKAADTNHNDDQPSSPPSSIVLSGPELTTLNDEQWAYLTRYDEIVFARTTPEQKLRIVREFQKDGNVVAMTGDGVNDAPSLRAADVGVAMGGSGASDMAIEAADMVLLDGCFSSVVEAVRSGRVVFDNLKKVICYLLPAGTFAEFWPVMTSVIFGLPQVLSSFLMIIIWWVTFALLVSKLITPSRQNHKANYLLS